MMSSELETQLMQFFECPVCLTYMLPPIFQCAAGHNVCVKCDFKLKNCPLCRGPKGGRAAVLEKLSLKMTFPCQYAIEGCEFSGKSYILKNHEADCQFSCRMCPLSKLRRCGWTGMMKDLVEHFTQKHPQYVYFESSPKLLTFGMWQRTFRRTVSLLYVYDTIFLFCWEFNQYRDQFRFCVTYYGCRGQEDRFSYAINILDGNTDRVAVRMSAPCYCTMEDGVAFMRSNAYVSVYFPMVEGLFTPQGNMRFVLKVKDNTSTTM